MSPRSARGPLLLVLVWAAGVVLATTVGLLAVRVVAEQVGDPVAPALSRVVDQVPAGAGLASRTTTAGPAASTVAPPTPTPTPTALRTAAPTTDLALPRSTGTAGRPAAAPPAPRPARPQRPATIAASFRSAGGTVGMQCTGTTARLLYVTPAGGYALDERAVSGPQVEVRFQADQTRLRMQLTCASGSPRLVDVRSEAGRDGTSGGSGSGKD